MTPPSVAQFEGCLLGLALGDAYCAPFEGGILERCVWSIIGRRRGKRRWTDDTQMSLDLAASLTSIGHLDQDDVARRFAASYHWSRGYGPGAAKILKKIRRGTPWSEANTSAYPSGSFGNGAAMRAPVIGLAYPAQPEARDSAARRSAEITHAHPLGIHGARIVAHATALALGRREEDWFWQTLKDNHLAEPFLEKVDIAAEWSRTSSLPAPRDVRARLGSGLAAVDSAVTGIYIGRAHTNRPFEDLLGFAKSCGGDTDTIAAITGAIWGAFEGSGKLPQTLLDDLEQEAEIRVTGQGLYSLSQATDP